MSGVPCAVQEVLLCSIYKYLFSFQVLAAPRGIFCWDFPYLWPVSSRACGLSCRAAYKMLAPHPGIKPTSLHWKVDSLPLDFQGSPLCFMYSSLNLLIPDSQLIPPLPFPLWCSWVFSMWVCFWFASKFIGIIFQIPHISDTYDICLFLWLHFTWSSLGPSTLLQMPLCHSFLMPE